MTAHTAKEKSRQVELVISHLLKIGVIVSLAVVVIGTGISFARHPKYLESNTDLQQLTNHAAVFPHTVGGMFTSIGHREGRGIIVLGLLLLVATPVMRVAVSILGFVYERDWAFVVITSTVLALLLLSFVLGRGEG